jgi:hypothetical protein
MLACYKEKPEEAKETFSWNKNPCEPPEKWAVSTFGAAELGDPRRTDRLIKVASGLAANPSASLPHASETWGETNGAYRFLSDPAFSYEEILLPHWSQTYHEASQGSRTLLLADTTEFDFTTHQALKGRGPVGNSKENIGFSLHTVLAMDPQTQQILGCLTLEPFIRKLAPVGETKAQAPRTVRGNRRCGSAVSNGSDGCQRTANGSTWGIAAAMSTHFGRRARSWAMTLCCGSPRIVMWKFLNRKMPRGSTKRISKRSRVRLLLPMPMW